MTISGAGGKARDHSGTERRLALIGHQGGFAFEDIDELVLVFVPVALRRPRAGRQFELVDPKLRQSEDFTQTTTAAFAARRVVRRRVTRSDPRQHVGGAHGNRCSRHVFHLPRHSTAHFGGRFSAKARRPSAASGLRRGSANLSAAKSSTEDSGSAPTFITTALVRALARGAQRSICFRISSSLTSSAAESFTR